MKPEVKVMIFSAIAGGALTVGASFLISDVIKPQPIPVIPYNLPQEHSQIKSFIRVVRTNDFVEPTQDPIWRVELILDNHVIDSIEAIIGRSYRQAANRHISGNESPLPQGRYSIDRQGIVKERFSNPELGSGYWIPINPLFSTDRSALGVHQDPSWGKTNGESGTSGCIGFKHAEDTTKLVDWIRKHNLRDIIVSS